MVIAEVPEDTGAAFAAARDVVVGQAHRFSRRFGCDPDEAESDAQLAFLRAHASYVTGRWPSGTPVVCSFDIMLRRWIWYTLLDAMRVRMAQQRRLPIEPCEYLDALPLQTDGFSVYGLGLSEDAIYAALLVLNPPDDVEAVAEAKGGEPRNYRSTVRAYLRAAGWRNDRISSAFGEIREALG